MKERVGTALSDQRQRSATAVTSLQAVRGSIAEILPQKLAMERHIEALVHERIQAIQLEGEALQKKLDSLCDRHLSDMTQRKKEVESTVETLLTFDVEAERELARGGLVDVNRHGEISEKLRIMYETMNRPVKKPPGFQATFIPTDVDCLVGYFETGDRPGHHGIDSPEIITQPSRVVSHMKEHTFRFGSVSQNGHETGSSLKDDWEKVKLRNKSNSQHEKGIRAGSFQGVRNPSASARYGDEKPTKGSQFPDRRTSSFSPRETPSENAKSVPYMRRQVSEPARPTQQSYTTRRPTQQPNSATRPTRESDTAYMSTQRSEPAIRSTQQTHMDTRPVQPSETATRPTQQSETASMPVQQSETASRPTQSLETANSNQTTIQKQLSEPARSTQQSHTAGGPTQDPDQAACTMPTLQTETAPKTTQESNTAPGPKLPSETVPIPSQQSETTTKPVRQPEKATRPTLQSETPARPTQQSDRARGLRRQSGATPLPPETAQMPALQPETARGSTEQSETVQRHTQQSDTAKGPIHQLEIPVRSTQQSDTTRGSTQQPDTAPSTAHAQQPETTGGSSQIVTTSQVDDTSDNNFVRWKTLRINSKEKVSKVLEFPSDEDVEIFL
ncbi:mucin-22-like isoform X2 [Branchiostoma lanceolatum]